MLRAIEQPLPVSSFLHPRSPALCDDCIMQSLHSAITPPAPPTPRQLSKSPTSRQVEKPTSRKVGKLANTAPFLFTLYPLSPPEPRSAANPPPCIPAALAILLSYPAGKPMPARPALTHLYPVAPLLRPAPPLPPAALAPTAPPTRAGCIPTAPCRPRRARLFP